MPHLSPLNWVIMSILFWLTLLIFITTMWWQQTPKFPTLITTHKKQPSKWNWK